MAFGLGFNKTKVLASAEKNVKAGKLSHAIADYEKICKHDPDDLNVLNTLGDLYARTGETAKASARFKQVAEAYAAANYTVKAIAMYKKLTKYNPAATDALLKLADYYLQQGLNSDARAQYALVGEQLLRERQYEAACVVLEKALELDPDNAAIVERIAEGYERSGKREEAVRIYLRTAELLKARGEPGACDRALERILGTNPRFAPAVLLRAELKLDAGDPEECLRWLRSLPDWEAQPDALKLLIRAEIAVGNQDRAEASARKLCAKFQDVTGLSWYADWRLKLGDNDSVLRVLENSPEELRVTHAPALTGLLDRLSSALQDDSPPLERFLELLRKTGNTARLVQITSKRAGACVLKGELDKAGDLYRELAALDPGNPSHLENARQLLGKLGGATPAPANEESAEREGFVHEATPVPQSYEPETRDELDAALTEAELFASYRLPERALLRLQSVLPKAPQDIPLLDTLATLYCQLSRFPDAAQCYDVMSEVYAEFGRADDARYYARRGANYRDKAAGRKDACVPPTTSQEAPTRTQAQQPEVPVNADSAIAVVGAPPLSLLPGKAIDTTRPEMESEGDGPALTADAFALPNELTRLGCDEETVSLSAASDGYLPASEPVATDPAVLELMDEAQFYLSQGMTDEARTALARAESLAPRDEAVRQLGLKLKDFLNPELAAVTLPGEELDLELMAIAPLSGIDAEPQVADIEQQGNDLTRVPAAPSSVEVESSAKRLGSALPEAGQAAAMPEVDPLEDFDLFALGEEQNNFARAPNGLDAGRAHASSDGNGTSSRSESRVDDEEDDCLLDWDVTAGIETGPLFSNKPLPGSDDTSLAPAEMPSFADFEQIFLPGASST